MLARIEQLCANPFDPLLSEPLRGKPGIRKSRVGGWRIVYEVVQDAQVIDILAVQRRGQVYKRL